MNEDLWWGPMPIDGVGPPVPFPVFHHGPDNMHYGPDPSCLNCLKYDIARVNGNLHVLQ